MSLILIVQWVELLYYMYVSNILIVLSRTPLIFQVESSCMPVILLVQWVEPLYYNLSIIDNTVGRISNSLMQDSTLTAKYNE